MLVGIGHDSCSEVDPFRGELACHEAEVVVEVVILMTEAEDEAEAAEVRLNRFWVPRHENIDGDGHAIPVTKAADALGELRWQAVMLQGIKVSHFPRPVGRAAVAELAGDEPLDGFGFDDEVPFHPGVEDDGLIQVFDEWEKELAAESGEAVGGIFWRVLLDAVLGSGLAGEGGDEGANLVFEDDELHLLPRLVLMGACHFRMIGHEGVNLCVPEGSHHRAMIGWISGRFGHETLQGIARLWFGPPLWGGEFSVHGGSISKTGLEEKNFSRRFNQRDEFISCPPDGRYDK